MSGRRRLGEPPADTYSEFRAHSRAHRNLLAAEELILDVLSAISERTATAGTEGVALDLSCVESGLVPLRTLARIASSLGCRWQVRLLPAEDG